MKLVNTLFAILSLLAIVKAAERGYGDPLENYPDQPNWQERAVEVLTNACRLDPQGYRDKYIGSYSILLPRNFPAVKPLYWSSDLNRSARAHAIDMANNCGMQHESCNGDSFYVRIYSYYTNSSMIGENIATANSQPQETMYQWIFDQVQRNVPAADTVRAAGHRKNIMNPSYKEFGAGYAYGPKQYNYFWVQDFGGGPRSIATYPIPGGSHIFTTGDSICFLANFYDSLGRAPTEASVVIDNQKLDMRLHLGNSGKGTYMRAEKRSQNCRKYYYLFTDAGGREWRYPQYGTLVTFGEGDCDVVYLSQDDMSVGYNLPHSSVAIRQDAVLVDLRGRIVNRLIVHKKPGVYLLRPTDVSNNPAAKIVVTSP